MHDALVNASVLRNSHLSKYLKIHFYGTWHIVCASFAYICNTSFRAKAYTSATNCSADTYMVLYMAFASTSDEVVASFFMHSISKSNTQTKSRAPNTNTMCFTTNYEYRKKLKFKQFSEWLAAALLAKQVLYYFVWCTIAHALQIIK